MDTETLKAMTIQNARDEFSVRCVITPELRAEAARYYADAEYREAMPWSEAPVPDSRRA